MGEREGKNNFLFCSFIPEPRAPRLESRGHEKGKGQVGFSGCRVMGPLSQKGPELEEESIFEEWYLWAVALWSLQWGNQHKGSSSPSPRRAAGHWAHWETASFPQAQDGEDLLIRKLLAPEANIPLCCARACGFNWVTQPLWALVSSLDSDNAIAKHCEDWMRELLSTYSVSSTW